MKSLLVVILFASISAIGQNANKLSMTFSEVKTFNMSEISEDWNINLQHIEAPKPGTPGPREMLLEKKREIMQRYPRQSASNPRAAGPAPLLGTNFEGNSFNGIPNDNDLAISRDSVVVSVSNRRIHIYNGNTEEQLLTRTLHNLVSDLEILGSKYDPKVIYDPNNDRFIIIFLNGFTWETSRIMLAFSETSDPTGDWHLYALPGNPLDNESWSDYPVVGISGKDLYIGINTFLNGSENNSGFVETCLWQIGLKEGYIGFDLQTNYFSDILPQSKAIFNICPIQAAAESDVENMYLLSNRNTDLENDTVFLLEVTGRVNDPNTELLVRTLQADQPYLLPVPADQQGNQWLDTNDGRVLGGYLLNNRIYYVQSCTDPATGRAGIYHGVIDDVAGAASITSRIYSDPDMDYGFPNISWTGLSINEEKSMISFNHSSETIAAGVSAIHINPNLDASDRIFVKSGISIVNVLPDTLERWGDYSGSQRMYNQPGVVWVVGSYAQSGQHRTWIGQLFSPAIATGIEEESIAVNTAVFPNPFINDLSIEFELTDSELIKLDLYDSNGKLVRTLLEDRVRSGKNRISFSDEFLEVGTYLLVASNSGSRIFTKQIIKQ